MNHQCFTMGIMLVSCTVAIPLVSTHAQQPTPPRPAPTVRNAPHDTTITRHGDSISIRLIDVDVRAAVEALGQYLDRPVVFGALNAGRVTLQTPYPIRRQDVLPLLRSTLESQDLELIADSTGSTYRVRAKTPLIAPPPPTPIAATATSTADPIQLFIIHISHARVVDVAATVNALYGRASAFGELGAVRPATLSQELAHNQSSTYGAMQNGAPPLYGPQTPPTPSSPSSNHTGTLSSDATIVSDQSTNSLLIRATRADYELIANAVKEIDVRPLQVLIEMLVVEVRRDRSLSYGLDATLPPHALSKNPNVIVSSSQTGLGLGDFVIRVLGAGGIRDLDLILNAAASHGDVSIISRPAVIAANNEQAQILVGSQRPFVQISRSLPTDAASRDQIVQYKDVGTKLIVRPTISSDGYVMLEVSQEINQATNEVQFNAPIISTRSVQTRLLLKDSQTVVIGGLRDNQKEVTQGGIPFLSAIPIIGGLFGHASRASLGTELFLFITPRVLHTDEDAKAITKPLSDRATEITK